MNAEMLLDAIGEIDEKYLQMEQKTAVVPWRRRAVALIAAVLLVMLCVGTAMALSPEFEQWVLSIFHLESREKPPASGAQTNPADTGPGLRKIDEVDIDGKVHAHYFTSGGVVLVYEGGFYTCSYTAEGKAPEDAAFWQIQKDEIVKVEAKRAEFPLTHGGRTFQIVFDYAVLNGKLAVRLWHQGLNEDPVGNGWQLSAIGDRTDVLLMGIPALQNEHYTFDYFLLELEGLAYTPLLSGLDSAGLTTDYCTVSEDLRYAILARTDMESGMFGYWVADLGARTLTSCDSLTGTEVTWAYFLDDATAIFYEERDGLRSIASYAFPTGELKTVAWEIDAEQNFYQVGKRYFAVCREENSGMLVDLRTGDWLELSGLNWEKITFRESPDASAVFIGYRQKAGERQTSFSRVGILHVESGVAQMLTRDTQAESEYFLGWLDAHTVVLSARDGANGYYVYVYDFAP